MYPNERTRAYICYRKTISTQKSQEGAKFMHKINKIEILIDTSRACHDALTYTMTHYTKLFKS